MANLAVSLKCVLDWPALVAMVTKIWDSTSNSEIIVRSMAMGLGRHCVRQNIAYYVHVMTS